MESLDERVKTIDSRPLILPASSDQIRVELAAERTFLAWIRTGLAMMGFGFIVARFGLFLREIAEVQQLEGAKSPRLSLMFGTALVFLGIGVNLLSTYRHMRFIRILRSSRPRLPSPWLSIAISILLAVCGMATATYLIILSQT